MEEFFWPDFYIDGECLKVQEKHFENGFWPVQGAYLGNLEYKAQSNNNADCVAKDSRFKFDDDLTTLEKINLLLVGMASHNLKSQVPSEVNVSNLIIPSEHLKSQEYLNKIQKWTVKK